MRGSRPQRDTNAPEATVTRDDGTYLHERRVLNRYRLVPNTERDIYEEISSERTQQIREVSIGGGMCRSEHMYQVDSRVHEAYEVQVWVEYWIVDRRLAAW